MWIDSFSRVLFFTPLFVLFNVWELKQVEEPELVRRFGDECREYRRRTPMFVPGLGRDRGAGRGRRWTSGVVERPRR